jgi:branched-chain amino acid transport system ATP-binding protein
VNQEAPPTLSLENVTMRFGGVVALRNVDLQVDKGDITALIGPNGAGKTTVFNVITGVFRPTEGAIRFDGARIDGLKRFQIAKGGIARTFQNIRLFSNMSALENVMVGADAHHRTGALGAALGLPWHRSEEKAGRERAAELLEFVGIGHRSAETAKNLPYGDQRRLEIARALATEPRLLLLDEPAAGMNPAEKRSLQDPPYPRCRTVGAADRTRHGAGDGHQRPDLGAGLRAEDRRRAAEGSTFRPAGDRGLPGSAGRCFLRSATSRCSTARSPR